MNLEIISNNKKTLKQPNATVLAELKCDITYPILVKKGTLVLLDPDNLIILINNTYHVTIEQHEYSIVFLN